MTDIVSKEKRSDMMANIKSKNTCPELRIRKALFKKGFRYRLHAKKMAGKPDIVLRRYKAVIFVNGCFWHGHEGCNLYRPPKTRTEFWVSKIEKNKARDVVNKLKLENDGWRCLIVWECTLKGRSKLEFESLINDISDWILGFRKSSQIRGIEQ